MTAAAEHSARYWRLGARARKATLVVHIVSAGSWIGVDVVMAVLIFTAVRTPDGDVKALCYQALALFAPPSLLAAGAVCLVSGVTLGLGSKYGLVRYWWVATKLGLNLLLTVLVPVALAPEVGAKAELARRFVAGEAVSLVAGDLIYPPIVSPTALLVAVLLAVFKPWGRIRRRPVARRSRR